MADARISEGTGGLPCAGLDWSGVATPCQIIDRDCLRRNVALLDRVQREADCRVLLALKGFATFGVFDLLRGALRGVCASSPYEARLGREAFGGEVHAYAPAYTEADVRDLLALADHLVFNSFAQWRRYRPLIAAAARPISCGLRVNPEYAEVAVPLYNPCAPGSRLGIRRAQFEGESLDGIEGLHFHALCEQDSATLERVLHHFEPAFRAYFAELRWVNFGGGHHITRSDYDIERLIRLVREFRARWPHLTVYLEPGEAAALNTGVLVASVLDVVENGLPIAILDTSAEAHMPDVLAMPYRPRVRGADDPGVKAHTMRLAGGTCLAGDVIGDYSFDRPLRVGDRIVFEDMAHYTTVKNTMFNGVRLPDLADYEPATGALRVFRRFDYNDYRSRLS